MSYKIVIPSAGLGSRIDTVTKYINKGLVTLGDKPAICRVIEQFPDNKEIVILTGYKSESLIEVVKQFYPNRKIQFISVDKYKGEGSGLGYSLLKARKVLNEPFIFISNDTLVGDENIALDPNEYGNWVAYHKITDEEEVQQYRTINVNEGKLSSINPKGIINNNVYVGICGIKDVDKFWEALNCENAISIGESYGLNALNDVSAIELKEWYDTGSLRKLSQAKKKYKNPDINILDKVDEAIWFNNDEVIKFNADPKFIFDRVNRLHYLPFKMVPVLLDHKKYTYKYKYVKGNVVSSQFNSKTLIEFCELCRKELWDHKSEKPSEYIKGLYKFYKDKTFARVKHYYDRFEQKDRRVNINGLDCSSVNDLLSCVDWKLICENVHISRFHGDLHGENILKDKMDYKIIDWRQDFNGDIEYGDAYYDIAKLRHGLLVNHGIVDRNLFSVQENNNSVSISINQYSNLLEADKAFLNYFHNNGFSVKKIKILTALIYLNICGLHEYPYSKFLYYYGQFLLQEYLNEK